MFKRLFATGMIAVIMLGMTGCSLNKIIEKNESVEDAALSNDELVQNLYYIKSGTKFYPVYMPENQPFTGRSEMVDVNRVAYFGLDEEKIPTLYKGESIALASADDVAESITLERFKDLGYSIGVYGAEYNTQTQDIYFPVQNVVPGCSIYNNLSGKSRNYRIMYVNDEPVDMDMINTSGVFTCFEKGQTYKIGYFAGTYYEEVEVKADVWMLCSYEIIKTNAPSMTKNGYASYTVPEDLKSGYYLVEGQGFFRYIAAERGTVDETQIAWNDPYYTIENEEYISATTQNYTIELDKRYTNVEFEILYDVNNGRTVNITGNIVFAGRIILLL